MAAPSAKQVAARLNDDNRAAVGSGDPGGDATKELVASGLAPTGASYGLTASTATEAAFTVAARSAGTDVVVPVGVPDGKGGTTLDKTSVRTQHFFPQGAKQGQVLGYDATKPAFGAKRVYVNDKGEVLKADGTKETAGVAGAADAETTPMTAAGEAVTNWAQVNKPDGSRTPPPGTYEADPLQTSLYVAYSGWTAQDAKRP